MCRWVNCLLIREIPFQLAIRLWDTYLAEGTRMRDFLTYVLAAFLLTWSSQLKRMEFQVKACLHQHSIFIRKSPCSHGCMRHLALLDKQQPAAIVILLSCAFSLLSICFEYMP